VALTPGALASSADFGPPSGELVLNIQPMLTGSFVVELIFSVPGVGRYYIASVVGRADTVVLAITVLLALLVVFVNLLVDLLHGLLDSRIRTSPGRA
jgi:ABC-type dipeptide/oligopeptide/nickel transport system permease component